MSKKLDAATENYLYPETATDALVKWDSGSPIFTVELGGLGPRYEQAIQILVFELIRDYGNRPLREFKNGDEAWHEWGSDAIKRCDESVGGFSDAQVGAAKSFAYQVLKYGWRHILLKAPDDRRTQVSKYFPKPPES